jgi:signal transduction histidine kinase/nitroreductase/CheY-like chemotaxis protein
MILRDQTDVQASASAVFAFFEDIERHYLAWHPDHRLFRWTLGRGLALGHRFHFEEVIAGKLLKKTVRITRLEPGRLLEFVPTFWLMRLVLPRMLFRIEPLAGGAQRVVAEIHLRVGPLGARLNRREFDAVRAHMRLEGINLERMVRGEQPLRQVPAASAGPATTHAGMDDARAQQAFDAQCLSNLLVALQRSLKLVPMIVLWGCLLWLAGLAPEWLALWLVGRLGLAAYASRAGRTWMPLVRTDAAAGLAATDRFMFVEGLHRALVTPLVFSSGVLTLQLLYSLLGAAQVAGTMMATSGRARTFLVGNLLPQAVLAGAWASHGGALGWSMALMSLLALPTSLRAVGEQRKAWMASVRLNLLNQDLAASLAAERDRAQAAADTRTRFFAAASHDLRQPLHALSINATTLELLARRGDDPRLRELSQSIGRALAQSQGLLDALLDISRLDAGAVKLQWGEHELGGLVRQLHAEFGGVAEQRGLGFVLEVEAEPQGQQGHWARTDADQLQRILRNLLDNAFKFTAAGEVRLTLARRRGADGTSWLRIGVADTGSGIPAAERERVFEEFHQLGNPARDRSQGLGLGLAIVRRTAAMLGAQVHLADAPGGRGALFEVSVPALARPAASPVVSGAAPGAVSAPALAARTAATGASAAAPMQGLAVLLVDDEADIVAAVAGLLQAVGWQAHTAHDAEAALALAAEAARRFDVALVDHRLPQGDGIELVDRLRALRPGLPAIIVTGDLAVRWQVLARGLRVLHKPLDGATLTGAIGDEVAAARLWSERLRTFATPGSETPMNLIDAIHGRRSVRSFAPDAPPREVIEDLLWHAVQVPLPPVSDEGSWALVVVEGRERLAALGERAKRYAAEHQPAGEPWTWPERADFEVFWGAPVLVLFCARRGHQEAPFDCCRAGQNLALAAHARGLGSCWVGAPMPWLASDEGRSACGLPPGFDAAAALVLGTPSHTQPGRSRPRPVVLWR